VDRLIFVGLSRLAPSTLNALTIVKPRLSSVGIVSGSDRTGAAEYGGSLFGEVLAVASCLSQIKSGHIYDAVRRGLGGRCDAVGMIADKGSPASRRRASSPDHVFGDAGLADLDPELKQLAMDSRRPPQRIGNAHLADQPSYFDRNRRSAGARS
jgi:hypothetical protein